MPKAILKVLYKQEVFYVLAEKFVPKENVSPVDAKNKRESDKNSPCYILTKLVNGKRDEIIGFIPYFATGHSYFVWVYKMAQPFERFAVLYVEDTIYVFED